MNIHNRETCFEPSGLMACLTNYGGQPARGESKFKEMRIRVAYVPVLMCCCAALLFWSCDPTTQSDGKRERQSASYLPLEVGNYWDFKSTDSDAGNIVQRREVKGVEKFNDHEYYLVTSSYSDSQGAVDSAYYRIGADGDVYVYRRTADREELRFKLLASDGEAWTYPVFDNDVMKVTTKVGPLQMRKGTLENCKHYYYNIENWADEEHTITLGPGVGFIREFSNAWGHGVILVKASIGGSVTEY